MYGVGHFFGVLLLVTPHVTYATLAVTECKDECENIRVGGRTAKEQYCQLTLAHTEQQEHHTQVYLLILSYCEEL